MAHERAVGLEVEVGDHRHGHHVRVLFDRKGGVAERGPDGGLGVAAHGGAARPICRHASFDEGPFELRTLKKGRFSSPHLEPHALHEPSEEVGDQDFFWRAVLGGEQSRVEAVGRQELVDDDDLTDFHLLALETAHAVRADEGSHPQQAERLQNGMPHQSSAGRGNFLIGVDARQGEGGHAVEETVSEEG